MRLTKNIFFFALLLIVGVGNISFKNANPTKPKKIILMIGDGMGLAQISGGMSFYEGVNAFERFKIIGLSKTSSSDDYVTDSGAGATALAIGRKGYNNSIGVDKDTLSPPSLFEIAKSKGLSTGVAVTSSVVHATPASFFSHVKHRNYYEEIAAAFLNNNCDVAIGGGYKFFTQRKDNRNLSAELEKKGMKVVVDTTGLKDVPHNRFIYLAAADGMPKMQQGRGDFLKRASLMAMQKLNANKNGYMLMIEGSQIDWGSHDMDFEYMKAELLDFNEAINAVLDEAQKDGNTLVIVTADHETGGLALTENKTNRLQFIPQYAHGHHTGIMVPVFAYGVGAENFGGIYENTEIYNKIKSIMGW